MRYYNFALPLFLMIAASQLSLPLIGNGRVVRYLIALGVVSCIAIAAYGHLRAYAPSFVDSPELRGLMAKRKGFFILSGLSLLSVLIWVRSSPMGSKVFLFLFFPLYLLSSNYFIEKDIRPRFELDAFDHAGLFTKQYLSYEARSKLAVFGSEPTVTYRALFHVDNPNSTLSIVPDGSVIDLSKAPADREWVLALGNLRLPNTVAFKLELNGFSLGRMASSQTIDFSKNTWPNFLERVDGFSSAEPWGRWSSKSTVTFAFVSPLPERFSLNFTAHAFGSNIGKQFTVHVGKESKTFTLDAGMRGISLEFSNDEKTNIVSIDIPFPVSPKELGFSEDRRTLGIGMERLGVIPLMGAIK